LIRTLNSILTPSQLADSHGSRDAAAKIVELGAIIASLTSTVQALQGKVDFLLSFVGAVQDTPRSVDKLTGASKQAVLLTVPTGSTAPYAPTFPSIPAATTQCSITGLMRQAAVAAVYSDIQPQARRAANIVVMGLKPSTSVSDVSLISNLIQNELHCNPDIVKCQRLGKLIPGKIQPILSHKSRLNRLLKKLNFYVSRPTW
jgi:hypothetical protein